MRRFKIPFVLLMVVIFSGCATVVSQEEYEECIWGFSVAGAAIGGAVGNVGGAAAGTAGGAAIGAFICGPVGQAPVAEEPMMEMAKPAEHDSDGDGVVDISDRCWNTPAGVTVDEYGCGIDSDGDGVPDYRDQCPNTSLGVIVDTDGCPLAGETLLTLENVNFNFDSAKLNVESLAILDQAVRVLRTNANVDVNIEGHTDSYGPESYNQGLSQRRAEAVKNYLVKQGISASRLNPVGRGEAYPVAGNDSREGRYRNRRVEFVSR